jgi:hypothetical protein
MSIHPYKQGFIFFLKAFLLVYISCTQRIHCDMSKYAYIIPWLGSPPQSQLWIYFTLVSSTPCVSFPYSFGAIPY